MFEWIKLVEAAKICMPVTVVITALCGIFAITGVAFCRDKPVLLWLALPVAYVGAVVTTMLVMQ
jgi:hypothetical protein